MSNDRYPVTAFQMAAWHIPALAIIAAVNPHLYFSGSLIANWFALLAGALLGGAFFWGAWLFLRWLLSRQPVSTYVRARAFFTASWWLLVIALCIQWEKALQVKYIWIIVVLVLPFVESALNVIIESVHGAHGQDSPAAGTPPQSDIQARQAEEAIYEQVAAEMAARQIKQGLWAKALVQADGSVERANPLYIKLRVQSLTDEAALKTEGERQTAVQQSSAEETLCERIVKDMEIKDEIYGETKLTWQDWLKLIPVILAALVALGFLQNWYLNR